MDGFVENRSLGLVDDQHLDDASKLLRLAWFCVVNCILPCGGCTESLCWRVLYSVQPKFCTFIAVEDNSHVGSVDRRTAAMADRHQRLAVVLFEFNIHRNPGFPVFESFGKDDCTNQCNQYHHDRSQQDNTDNLRLTAASSTHLSPTVQDGHENSFCPCVMLKCLRFFFDHFGVAHCGLQAIEAVDPFGHQSELKLFGDAHIHLLAVDD